MTGALFDHLWQSSLFLAAVGLMTLLLSKNRAAIRYGLWLAASCKFLVPFLLFSGVGAFLPRLAAPPAAAPLLEATAPFVQPFAGPAPLMLSPAAGPLDLAPWLLTLWGIGIGAITASWLVRGFDLRQLARHGQMSALEAPVPVVFSHRQIEPGLIGIFRPVLLLPQGITEALAPRELETIVAHEVCHHRRKDNLTAAFHMLVSALFWFWPPVWWLGARLLEERERAVDEAVVAEGGDARTYADAILKVCKFYLHSPLACAAGVSGGALKLRLEAIMNERRIVALGPGKRALLATGLAVALAIPIAAGALRPEAKASTAGAIQAGPHPGTEAFIRRQIAAFARPQHDYSGMSPGLAQAARDQLVGARATIRNYGPLQSVLFKGRDTDGCDIYLVTFARDRILWAVGASGAGGAIERSVFGPGYIRESYARPSPGTEASLRRYIASVQRGRPNYEEMVPAMADTVRHQQASIIPTLRALGALRAITFKGVTPMGWDVYEAVFEQGRADWTIAPLTADGKVERRGFRIKA